MGTVRQSNGEGDGSGETRRLKYEISSVAASVNQSAAQKLWPGSNPIGKRIELRGGREKGWMQVIGLVNDVRMSDLERPSVPFLYTPMSQSHGVYSGQMLVRIAANPSDLVPLLRKALQAVDRDAALGKIETLDQILDSQYAGRRFNLLLISIFPVFPLQSRCDGRSHRFCRKACAQEIRSASPLSLTRHRPRP